MDLCIIWLQLKGFFIRCMRACSIVLTSPSDTQIVMAGRQFWTLLGGILKQLQGIVELLLLQRSHTLENKHFRLCQPIAELVQGPHLIEFLLRGGSFPLGTQCDTQVVVRLLEIGLYFDRSLKRGNRSGRVAARLELPAEVCLCFWIFRIDLDRFAKLGERTNVIALPTQYHAQKGMRRCKSRFQVNGATTLGRGTVEITELLLG